MALIRRPGTQNWHIEFELLGEKVRQSAYTTSKKEASELEDKLRKDVRDRLKLGKLSSMTFFAAVERFYQVKAIDKKRAGNRRSVKNKFKHLLLYFGPNTLLTEITKTKVATWQTDMIKRGLNPSTINLTYSMLMSLINLARENWEVECGPYFRIKRLDEDGDRIRWLTPSAEAKFLIAAPSREDRELLTFYCDSGCRKLEAIELQWWRLTQEDDGRWTVLLLSVDTKSKRSRRIPLSRRCTAIIERKRAARPDADDHDRVFLRPDGRAYGDIQRMFRETWARAKITARGGSNREETADFTIHDMRHHYACVLVQNGVPMMEVRDLLGHSKISMTEKYAFLQPDNLIAAIRKLDAHHDRVLVPQAAE